MVYKYSGTAVEPVYHGSRTPSQVPSAAARHPAALWREQPGLHGGLRHRAPGVQHRLRAQEVLAGAQRGV